MKKLFYLIPALLLVALIYQGCQQQMTEPDNTFTNTRIAKEVYNLLGPNDEAVGKVNVWNDADFLYVGFNVDDPYCIQTTEVIVATTEAGLSGAEVFAHVLITCPTTDYYEIPLDDLGIETCDDIVVAASAVLNDPNACTETTYEFGSGNVTTTVLGRRSGNGDFTYPNTPAVNVYEPGNGVYPAYTVSDATWEHWSLWDANLNWSVAAGVNQFRPGGQGGTDKADWIWESYRISDINDVNDEDYHYGSVLQLETTFDLCGIPSGAATLYIACDNGFEVMSLNSTPLGYKWAVFTDDWQTSTLMEANVHTSRAFLI